MEKTSSRRQPALQTKKNLKLKPIAPVDFPRANAEVVGLGPSVEERVNGLLNKLSNMSNYAEVMLNKAGVHLPKDDQALGKAAVGLQDKVQVLEGIAFGLEQSLNRLDVALFDQGSGRTN